MRHQVPQFIDIEDKLFGPLTFRQSIYMAGSIGAAFAIFYGLGHLWPGFPLVIKLALSAPFVAIGILLSFVRVNKRPFIFYLEAAFYYLINSKKYIWKKKEKKVLSRNRAVNKETSSILNESYVPKVSRSRLKDLAWSLDMDDNN